MGVRGLTRGGTRLPRWAVTGVALYALAMSALGSGLWLHHHVWVKHHRPWLYDEYRAGYAAGLQIANTPGHTCADAVGLAYPRTISIIGGRRTMYTQDDDVSVFFGGCRDGQGAVRGAPKQRISEILDSED
jgi:hypothetical protein